MLNLTADIRELKHEVEEEIESLLWSLSYNYLELKVKYIQENIQGHTQLNNGCKLKELSKDAYKLKGLSSKVITLTGDLEEDVTNLLYGIVTVITGIEEPILLANLCSDLEELIAPTISLNLSDYREERQASREYDDYYNIGNQYATLSQLEEDRLSEIADF